MTRRFFKTLILTGFLMHIEQAPALAADKLYLQVNAVGIDSTGTIEPKYAFCVPAAKNHTSAGQNFNIGLRWSKGPEGTKSYAIIAVDPDVPVDFSTANKEGKVVSVKEPRRPFYHWVLLDIPADKTEISVGEDSSSTATKKVGQVAYGVRGINDYTTTTDIHGGYDGPCPPWNDELLHHYHFSVYALNADKLGGDGYVTGEKALQIITPHIIASGEVIGLYTQTPALIGKP